MALPWTVAIAIEWGVLRWVFADALEARGRTPREAPPPLPRAPLAVLAFTLAGFVAAGPLGLDAAWPAARAARSLMAVRATRRRSPWRARRPAAARVRARPRADRARARRPGLGDVVNDILPDGTGLLALLGATALAAVLANLLNNVPRCSCCFPRPPRRARRRCSRC